MSLSNAERPVKILHDEQAMLGILHGETASAKTGVLIAVGGPQYRVGSHRQFVTIARGIAGAGFPVLRFDFVGMGDSDGRWKSFESVGEQLKSATDELMSAVPSLQNIVLLGLCDAASAILMNCMSDARVSGLVLINPWARTGQGQAKSYLRYYYVGRLFQKSFWNKVFSGRYKLLESLREFFTAVKVAVSTDNQSTDKDSGPVSYLVQMGRGLSTFEGPICFLISGLDLTAREFTDWAKSDKVCLRAMKSPRITMYNFSAADHTMTRVADLQRATECIIEWLRKIG